MSLAAWSARLGQELRGTRFEGRLSVVDEVDSTNDELRRRADAGAPAGSVLVARSQTAGRGRRGRRWVEVPGAGLQLSLLWRAGPSAVPTRWTLAAAVAACDACRALGAAATTIEWPNDLRARGRKLGGILVEARSAGGAGQEILVGVGINVHHDRETLERLGLPDATSLRLAAPSGIVGGRGRLAAGFLQELDRRIDGIDDERGWEAIREAWMERSPGARDGAAIVTENGTERRVRTAGLAPDGGLVVVSADGRSRVIHHADAVRYTED